MDKRRSFGGKLNGFVDKREANFEKKHLKAYLRGWEYFSYGRDMNGYPIYYKTKEVWTDE